VLRKAADDELGRSVASLNIPGEARPHYIAYIITDHDRLNIAAVSGSLTVDRFNSDRELRVIVRAGTPQLDNTNAPKSRFEGFRMPLSWLPREADYGALRQELWSRTDEEYKQALDELGKKKSLLAARLAEPAEAVPDFSTELPHVTESPPVSVDIAAARQNLLLAAQRLSKILAASHGLRSSVKADVTRVRRRLLTSDKTWADETHVYSKVSLSCEVQAADGMTISYELPFTASLPSSLSSLETMETAAKSMLATMTEARGAPLVDNGNSVVLFERQAATALIQTVLGDGLSGTPPRRAETGDLDRSFASKLGIELAAPLLDLVDDPTRAVEKGESLWGAYSADDEGVPARKVTLIQRGVLKTLLMSRTPRKEVRASNGHFRLSYSGGKTTIGNLFVSPRSVLNREQLLKLAAGKARRRPVYIVRRLAVAGLDSDFPDFSDIASMLAAGQPSPGVRVMEAYRLLNGKEVPVRGMVLPELDIRTLKDVIAAGSDAFVSNLQPMGIPVSIVSPPLLIDNVAVKRWSGENAKLPSYPPPSKP
jgi:TldD protein